METFYQHKLATELAFKKKVKHKGGVFHDIYKDMPDKFVPYKQERQRGNGKLIGDGGFASSFDVSLMSSVDNNDSLAPTFKKHRPSVYESKLALRKHL